VAAPDPCWAPPILGGRIGSGQGWRLRPSGLWKWHSGVDILAPAGTPILAIADGTIDQVYPSGAAGVHGYGNVILLRHAGDWFSMHAHCLWTRQDRGAFVPQRQTIAAVGNTAGYPDRPTFAWAAAHLHLECVSDWPLRPDDLAHRYDVRATLEALGIDTSGRFRWRSCAGSTAAPPRAQAPGAAGDALPLLALGVIVILERRRRHARDD